MADEVSLFIALSRMSANAICVAQSMLSVWPNRVSGLAIMIHYGRRWVGIDSTITPRPSPSTMNEEVTDDEQTIKIGKRTTDAEPTGDCGHELSAGQVRMNLMILI